MSEDNKLPGNKLRALIVPLAFAVLLFSAPVSLGGVNTCSATAGSCPSDGTTCTPPTDRSGAGTGGTPFCVDNTGPSGGCLSCQGTTCLNKVHYCDAPAPSGTGAWKSYIQAGVYPGDNC